MQRASQQLSSYTFGMMDFSTGTTTTIEGTEIIDYAEELLQFVRNILK